MFSHYIGIYNRKVFIRKKKESAKDIPIYRDNNKKVYNPVYRENTIITIPLYTGIYNRKILVQKEAVNKKQPSI